MTSAAREDLPDEMRQATSLGRRIEDESFAIIDAEVGAHAFGPREWPVVRRVIHATGDLEFRERMRFSPGAVEAGVAALRRGAPVVADVKMILAGLSEERLARFGSRAHCFISDPDVVEEARRAGTTRAVVAMRRAAAAGVLDGALVAVGNAPTALLELVRLVREEGARPALVIAVPVGFVSAAASKELAAEAPVPSIAARGRKGGSTIAVAVLHALLAAAAEGA